MSDMNTDSPRDNDDVKAWLKIRKQAALRIDPRTAGARFSIRMEFMICCLRNTVLEGFTLPVRPTAMGGVFLRFARRDPRRVVALTSWPIRYSLSVAPMGQQ